MQILLEIVLLLVGFVLLIKGADWFVDGSAALAQKFKVPGVIIGLTIVAMGTSAPELAVSTSAALSGSNEIAVSNVLGSNIFNLLMVLGVCAMLAPLPVESNIMKRDYPYSIIFTIILALFASSALLFGNTAIPSDFTAEVGNLSRVKGLVLLALFILYMAITISYALKNRTEGDPIESMPMWKCIIAILIGIAAIVAGGQLVVNNAKSIALFCGMSETLVGLTIVAIGTSLPELVTSVVAAKKGENGMAIGNVIGSNIFNLLFILGISSSIHPIGVSMESVIDVLILIAVNIMCFVFAKTKKRINRYEGAVMVLVYCAYTAFAIIR